MNPEGIACHKIQRKGILFLINFCAISARNYTNPQILFSEDKNPLPLHKLGIFMHNSEKDAKGKNGALGKIMKNPLISRNQNNVLFTVHCPVSRKTILSS